MISNDLGRFFVSISGMLSKATLTFRMGKKPLV
jgi:hypothetical protein